MAKNNYFINQAKIIAKKKKILNQGINDTVPSIYAAIALALHRSGVLDDDINYIFSLSQSIWYESIEKGIDMIKMCEEETGISLQNKQDEIYKE